MLRFVSVIATLPLMAVCAVAQEYNGNWACRDGTTAKAGILTLYSGVYGFASTTFGDAASGTGTITGYTDGVGFNDGPLRASRGVEAGRLVADAAAGVAIQLETSDAAIMLCTPRG